MGSIQLFDVAESRWRFGVDEAGQPYVVAADIARALGYRDAGNALRLVDDEERGTQIVSTPSGDQRMSVLYEDGIWELIFLSRKPEARAIKKRVKEILREIRETGRYEATPGHRLPQSYAEALRELAATVEEKERIASELATAAPKAESWDVLASGEGDYAVADAAKILSRDPGIELGERRLFLQMAAAGWVHRNRCDNRWRAYQSAVDAGRLVERARTYTHPITGETTIAAPQVRVTPKGLHDLRRLLGTGRHLQIPLGGAA